MNIEYRLVKTYRTAPCRMVVTILGFMLIIRVSFSLNPANKVFTCCRSLSSLAATMNDKEALKTQPNGNAKEAMEWEVYVDQSKSSLERGASATLDAFLGLAPKGRVLVTPAIFSRPKVKGPIIRCVPVDERNKDCFEVSNVDSVDKVYRILTRHLRVSGVNTAARECLKYKFIGNGQFEEGLFLEAIEAYSQALDAQFPPQEGIILLMRATAYLERANLHKKELQSLVGDLAQSVPDPNKLELLYQEAYMFPSLSGSILERVVSDTKAMGRKFRKTKYRHGLYQYALLHAAQDSLRATQLLPDSPKSWLRAGEILSELWKLKESAKYYERAIELDPSLKETLSPMVGRLKKRQELLDGARAYGWSEDTLRLALDVARWKTLQQATV